MTRAALELVSVVVDVGGGAGLDDVTIEIPPAVAFGVLGPEGADKTALCRVIRGDLSPRSGRVRLDGRRPSPWALDFHRQLGVVEPITPALAETPIDDVLRRALRTLGLSRFESLARVRSLLRRFDLWRTRNVSYAELGTAARFAFEVAHAFVAHPAVVVVDDPARELASADADALRDATRALALECRTALLVLSSRPTLIETWCDSAVVMVRGRVVARDVIGSASRRRAQWMEVMTRGNALGVIDRMAMHPRVLDVWEENDRMLVAFDGSPDDVIRDLVAAGAAIIDARRIVSPLGETYEAIIAGASSDHQRIDTAPGARIC